MVRNELIPMDVIKFINKYDKDFLQIYNTYNVIYNSRNKNPLYRNLKNKDLKIEEKAIAMSSLITKILISCSKIEDINEREIFAKAMNIDKINQAINEYALTNNSQLLEQCCDEVRELLQILYVD